MFFEQVYRYDDTARRFRLRKLAPRMPGTISEIILLVMAGWSTSASTRRATQASAPRRA